MSVLTFQPPVDTICTVSVLLWSPHHVPPEPLGWGLLTPGRRWSTRSSIDLVRTREHVGTSSYSRCEKSGVSGTSHPFLSFSRRRTRARVFVDSGVRRVSVRGVPSRTSLRTQGHPHGHGPSGVHVRYESWDDGKDPSEEPRVRDEGPRRWIVCTPRTGVRTVPWEERTTHTEGRSDPWT